MHRSPCAGRRHGFPSGSQPLPGRRAGFTTILVLILIFLMFVLVVSYLRVMRTYAIRHHAPEDGSMVILGLLNTDIAAAIGADGAIGPREVQISGQLHADIHEPYDYPWVNTARHAAPVRVAYPRMKTSRKGLGDPLTDDAWLTAAEPVAGRWPQVSCLTGSFLVYDNADLKGIPPCSATKEAVPEDAPAGDPIAGVARGQSVRFLDLPTSDERLVDADGDGVGDSLWFYPRVNVIGGIRYVAALKVVDLSGMLNINTALGEFGSDPGAKNGTARKGEGAYEVDARPLLGAMPSASQRFRQSAAAGFPAPSGRAPAAWTDWDYWMTSGTLVGPSNAESVGNILSPSGVRTGIRYDLDDDAALRDSTDRLKSALTPAPVIVDHYASVFGNPALRGKVTTQSAVHDRVAPVPYNVGDTRHQWTGKTRRAMDLSINQEGERGVTCPSRQPPDGNAMFGSWPPCFMQELLQGVDSTMPNDDYPFPEGFRTLVPNASERPRQYREQMGHCLADALGRDNMPTANSHWMGWKPLPMLTEFYGQMPYYICGGDYAPTTAGSTDGRYSAGYINTTDTRTSSTKPALGQTAAAAGIGSYALELANPYTIPIRLANVRFQFKDGNNDAFDESGDGAGGSHATSLSLDTYITASPPAGMAKDAEGFWVLKPGERIVFYRNGTESQGHKPFGGSASVAGLISGGAGVYAVDMGTATTGATAAPDLNGHPNSGNQEHIEMQVRCRLKDGSPIGGDLAWYAWMPYGRLTYPALPSGRDGRSFIFENNIPPARKGAAGDLVYKQVDVRTFGVDQKLNLLQIRPPAISDNAGDFPVDLGDCEIRTNQHGAVGSGVLPNGSLLPYPGLGALDNHWSPAHNNTGSMPVKSDWLQYDPALSTLGKAAKVGFPGPNGGNAMYGGARQDIKNGELFWNHAGIPSDAARYPGTFPELMADMACRDNANAHGTNPLRRDGIPRVPDLAKVLMVGPIYRKSSTTRDGGGNRTYRGNSGQEKYNARPTVDQLTSFKYQNTIGDAINFYLAKDAQVNGASAKGLPGLCLRSDVAFHNPAKMAESIFANKSLADLYAEHDAAVARFAALPVPSPSADGYADYRTIDRNEASQKIAALAAGIRLHLFWSSRTWADVIASRFQVDSPGWKAHAGRHSREYKPGVINLNTASADVLKCLSLPAGADAQALAAGIVQARAAPAAAAAHGRKGLAFVDDLKAESPARLLGAAPASGLGDLLAWLPAQASCRSDTFVAYVLLQGYRQDDFNAGPVSVRRAIVYFTRDTGGGAQVVKTYLLPSTR